MYFIYLFFTQAELDKLPLVPSIQIYQHNNPEIVDISLVIPKFVRGWCIQALFSRTVACYAQYLWECYQQQSIFSLLSPELILFYERNFVEV